MVEFLGCTEGIVSEQLGRPSKRNNMMDVLPRRFFTTFDPSEFSRPVQFSSFTAASCEWPGARCVKKMNQTAQTGDDPRPEFRPAGVRPMLNRHYLMMNPPTSDQSW